MFLRWPSEDRVPGPEKENAAMSAEAELRAALERLKRENEALKTRPKTGRRRVLHFNVTANAAARWMIQQLREAFSR